MNEIPYQYGSDERAHFAANLAYRWEVTLAEYVLGTKEELRGIRNELFATAAQRAAEMFSPKEYAMAYEALTYELYRESLEQRVVGIQKMLVATTTPTDYPYWPPSTAADSQ